MGAKDCDNLISYLIGELTEEEAVCFKDHLEMCPSCSEELEDLQYTWFSLSYDREDKEAPQSLKADIMSQIFANERPKLLEKFRLLSLPMTIFNKFLNLKKTRIAIALLLICLFGLGWDNFHLRTLLSVQENFSQKDPIFIKNAFNLEPQNASNKAKGMVYLVQDGNENRLIMQVHQIPQIKGTEIYKAWLLYDGRYWNCGSFKSNQSGEGVLTYLVPPKVQVQGFKITLEENPGASQPHGQVILNAF